MAAPPSRPPDPRVRISCRDRACTRHADSTRGRRRPSISEPGDRPSCSALGCTLGRSDHAGGFVCASRATRRRSRARSGSGDRAPTTACRVWGMESARRSDSDSPARSTAVSEPRGSFQGPRPHITTLANPRSLSLTPPWAVGAEWGGLRKWAAVKSQAPPVQSTERVITSARPSRRRALVAELQARGVSLRPSGDGGRRRQGANAPSPGQREAPDRARTYGRIASPPRPFWRGIFRDGGDERGMRLPRY